MSVAGFDGTVQTRSIATANGIEPVSHMVQCSLCVLDSLFLFDSIAALTPLARKTPDFFDFERAVRSHHSGRAADAVNQAGFVRCQESLVAFPVFEGDADRVGILAVVAPLINTAVGDRAFRKKSQQIFAERMQRSSAILVNHTMAEVRKFCNAGVVLEGGKAEYFEDLEEAIALHDKILG